MTPSNWAASRRELLSWIPHGLGGAALATLLAKDGHLAGAEGGAHQSLPHHPPRAKRVIHIFLCGGLSHIDSFDYKPSLVRQRGRPLPEGERPDVFFGKLGLLRPSDWPFRQRGQSGLWISDLFPCLAGVADELVVIRSMTSQTGNHTPATFVANTGFQRNGFPSAGAWLSYGLGSETDELPAYVVLPDERGVPAGGSIHWTSGFLPARHQGVAFQTKGPTIANLQPAVPIPPATESASRQLLDRMNRRHLESRPGEDLLLARMRSYELAARMQLAVPEVSAIERETPETQAIYGLDQETTAPFGRSCLLARRLVERGVRFVQIFSGSAFGQPRINWDAHEDVVHNHSQEAARIDQPVAALLVDLRRRGLLDETLVLCTTEFGRTPFTQSNEGVLGAGRDHNQYGFSVWMAGAGLRRGTAYGSTDEIGLRAVENPVTWHDFHATVLHLAGIDHTRLTYYHNGIARRLTDVHGHVLSDILG